MRLTLRAVLLDFSLVRLVVLAGFGATLLGFRAVVHLAGTGALGGDALNTTFDGHVNLLKMTRQSRKVNRPIICGREKLEWCAPTKEEANKLLAGATTRFTVCT